MQIPSAPHTLVAKFSLGNADRRKQVCAAYTRDVRFYQELVHQTSVPAPACYYAGVEAETGEREK